MASDKSKIPHLVCGLILVITGNVFLWHQFATDLNFYIHQRPAMCVEGRAMEESIEQSRLGVDDSQRNKGTVTMQCSFPVAVYPCLDEDVANEDWNGNCRTLAQVPQEEWPRRQAEPGITCCERDCLADKCSAKAWSCSTGSCDAYEKSTRLCVPLMRIDPYPCFTIEGEPDEGVRDGASSFPVGLLVGAIVISLFALGCCCFTGWQMSEEENLMAKGLAFLCGVAVVIAFSLSLYAIVNAALGSADDKGVVETNYADLASSRGSANVTAVAIEAPPPAGLHWAMIVLIVLLSIYGLFCILGCCLWAFSKFIERASPANPVSVEPPHRHPMVFGVASKAEIVQPCSRV